MAKRRSDEELLNAIVNNKSTKSNQSTKSTTPNTTNNKNIRFTDEELLNATSDTVKKTVQAYKSAITKTDSDGVRKWFEDAGSAMEAMQTYNKKNQNRYNRNYGGSEASKIKELLRSSSDVWDYLDKHKDEYEDYDELDSVFSEYRKALMQYDQNNYYTQNYYSQFEDEEQYNTALRAYGYKKKHEGKNFDEVQKTLSTMADGEEKNWLTNYQYDMYRGAKDFKTKSASGWNRYEADQRATAEEAEDEDLNWFQKLGKYLYEGGVSDTTMPLGNTSQIIHSLREDTSWQRPTDKWNDEQRDMYGYLYGNNREEAYNYARLTSDKINQAELDEKITAIEEWSTQSGMHMTAATLGAIASMPLSLADTMAAMTEYQARGFISTPNTVTPTLLHDSAISAISNALNEKSGVLGDDAWIFSGKGLGDVYQLGTSIASSMLSAYTMGTVGTYMVFFGSAAASGINDAKERGATDGQAIKYGVALGLAEAAAEAFSVEKLLSREITGTTLKAFLFNVLQQAGFEGSEEGVTTLLNNLAEQFIMGDLSSFNVSMNYYMSQGMSEEEAKAQAWKDHNRELLYSMFAGAVSGGVSGGLSTGVQNIFINDYSEREYSGVQDELIAKTLENNPNNEFAQRMQTKAEKGKWLSGAQLNELMIQNEATMREQDIESIRSTAEARLTELGETGDVNAIATALAKQTGLDVVAGEKLSRKEQQVIKNSKYGQQVADELKQSNARPGDTFSKFERSVRTDAFAKKVSKFFDTDNTSEEVSASEQIEWAAGLNREKPTATNVSETGKTVLTTGDEVEVEAISSVGNGKMTVRLTDGRIVTSDSVLHASDDDARLYQTVAELASTPGNANVMIQGFKKSGMSNTDYNRGLRMAHLYGKNGVPFHQLRESESASKLSEAVRMAAYKSGQKAGGREVAKAQAEVRSGKKTATKTGVQMIDNTGKAQNFREYMKSSKKTLNERQEAGLVDAEMLNEAYGISFRFYESYTDWRGKSFWINENGIEEKAPNGMYRKGGVIYVDLNAGASRDSLVLFTLGHELTHFIKEWSPAKFEVLKNAVFKQLEAKGYSVEKLIANQIAKAKRAGRGVLSPEDAAEEVVADAMEGILADGKVMQAVMNDIKVQDQSLWDKIVSWLKDAIDKLKNLVKAYDGAKPDSVEGRAIAEMKDAIGTLEQLYADALKDAGGNFKSASTEVTTDVVAVEETTHYSFRSLAEAAGFEAVEDENGNRAFMRDGENVSKVTVDDIDNSPIGALINFSLEMNDIDDVEADRQKKLFADICNMAIQTNDFAMTMQFVGSTVFTGMKANADKQYGTTYDFPSICTKTQAVIDAMSAKMVKLGRGLTHEEIKELYNEVHHMGNPVPCPECYVFSRWIGIGGLLNNIKSYQEYYGNMPVSDVATAYREMHAQVEASAKELGISFGKAKGALASKYTKEYNKLTEKIEKQMNQGESVKKADMDRLRELEPMMNTVKGMTWLENVYFADSSLKKVNPNFRVPDDVLFDLNRGEVFATQYKEAWAFRTTQGAGYGKAITPYAEARLGEGILGTNSITNTVKGKAQGNLNNPFLKQKGKLDADTRKRLKNARLKQKIQAFIGGQRFQSTSDARYENASDYLLAALEMQAMGGMVQAYTKVDGAVPAFAAWGFSINQSLMPKNSGLDANGNVVDTPVGGMSPNVAFKNRELHESAGTITIGVNDNHIRAMFRQIVRDFIIPYHASGGKADLVAAFRAIQDDTSKEEMTRSSDYSRTQSDKVLSDEVLRWMGKTEAEIAHIHEVRNARLAILTKGSPNMSVVRGNRFLSALYDKLNGGEWDGVKLPKGKVESQIFPNEFWDQSVTYEESGKITRDYLEYCEDLGFLHRFSGMVPSNGKLVSVKGYDEHGNRVNLTDLAYKYDAEGNKTDEIEDFFWKVLTDRRMYDNDGNYLPQKIVTLRDTTESTVTNFAKFNHGRQYNKELSKEFTDKIKADAETKFSNRDAEVADDFTNHMKGIISKRKGWYRSDVFDYIKEHPELDFVERIYAKDKKVKTDLKKFLDSIDSTETLEYLSWYIGESYSDKDSGANWTTLKMEYPYRGPVRTFRNAIKKRENDIMAAKVGGTKLGIKNGEVSLAEVRDLYHRLNSNEDMTEFANKVFDTAERLGVNIRFVNQTFSKGKVAGDALGDMLELKTSYFNDAAVSDQRKSQTILHEMLHICTVYVLEANPTMGDVSSNQYTDNWDNISNAATRLNRIYNEIQYDPDFKNQYGIKNAKEMVAELANPEFVGLLKKKSLWETIVDWICELFGHRRGNSAYDNAKMCVDYILDNPEVEAYKDHAKDTRKKANWAGYDTFGETKYSDRVLMGSLFSGGGTLEAGLVYQMVDKQFAVEKDAKIASVYTDNHGKEHMFVGDVQDFDSKKKDNVFYLHASPSCKDYSVAKKNGGETTLDILTAEATARVLEEQMPPVFTLENVKQYRGSEAYKLITNKLDELGYSWDVDVYNSAHYGAATARERLIIRAVKDGALPAKPKKTGFTTWYDAVADLIDELPEAPMPNWMRERYDAGNYRTDMPLFILGGNKSTGLSTAYADKPAPTLLASSHDARIVMPDGRVLKATPRAMARIQGLPDNYKLPKQTTRAYTVIGNGIPTQLTKAVMGGVLDHAYEQTHGKVLYSDRTEPIAQTFTSAGTSLPKQLPALFKDKNAVFVPGGTNVDIGAGKTPRSEEFLAEMGISYYPFDPYNRSKESNERTLKWLQDGNLADTVTCANVLNVIDTKSARSNVILEAAKALKPNGTAYFTTHEGSTDKKGKRAGDGVARQTGKDTFQNYKKTEEYTDEIREWFGDVERKGSLIIAKNPKSNLPKATWEVTPGEGIRYSDRDPLTDQEVLKRAAEGLAIDDLTDAERDALNLFKKRMNRLEGLQAQRKKLGEDYRRERFTKGGDKEKAEEIHKMMTQTDRQIDKARDDVLKVEQAEVLRRVLHDARKLVEAEERKRVYAREKEKFDKREAKIRKEYADRRDKVNENRKERNEKKELRRKIRKTIRDLDKLLNKGDKKKNVKEDMKELVTSTLKSAEILFTDDITDDDLLRNGIGTPMNEKEKGYVAEAVKLLDQLMNLDPKNYGTYEALTKAETELRTKLNYRKSKLKDVLVRERIRLSEAKVDEVLNELSNAYAKLQKSEYGYVKGTYNETLHQYLLWTKEQIGGTLIKDMSVSQMEELHKVYTMILTTVRDANKTFADNLKETIERLATRVMFEVHQAGGEHGGWLKIGNFDTSKLSEFWWNNLKPIYAFERTGSSTLMRLFKNIRKGEDKWFVNINEADAFRRAIQKKYNFDSWDTDEMHRFTSAHGTEFSLTLEQMMSLYAYSKRKQAHSHLLNGGFVFDNAAEEIVEKNGVKLTYLKKSAKTHTLDIDILKAIIGKLTAEQIAYVDEMQEYLSSTMGEKGNEVSMQLYGVKLFGEKYYFPLRSAGQYMERARETDLKKQQGQINIVNSGFSKMIVPEASNPVVLSNFSDVWNDHVNEMSMYNAFVLPLEDFRKVWNYSSPNADGEPISVNSVIQNAYGDAAVAYFDQLIKDLNGGALSDNRENIAKRLTGLFKKSAVFASLSVVIQQPMSVVRAFAEIDPKYFVGEKVNARKHKETWAELKKYAPVAGIKEMGYFDTGMGMSARDFLSAKEYKDIKEKAKALVTDSNYRDELLGKAPALADEIAWCLIWSAVKRETKANNPKMDIKSEEFLQMCGDRFTDIVTRTQVYDSVLARSANMRSKSALMTMATSFGAEPTTVANMVDSAVQKLKKGDKQGATRQLASVLGSIILTGAAVSLVYAMRDDDEDETFLEKYMQSFAVEVVDGMNPMTYLPFVRDVWSILQGYDVERADMSLITDVVSSMQNIVKLMSKDTSNMSEEALAGHKKQLFEAYWGAADYLFAMFGLPVKNIRRDIKGAFNVVKVIGEDLSGRDTTWGSLVDKTWDSVKRSLPVIGWTPAETTQDKLYKAIVSGDKVYADRLKGTYKNQSAVDSAIRKALRTNDPRIKEAAIAWNAGKHSEYMKIAKSIIAEKNFSQDNIVKAITAEADALAPDESTGIKKTTHVGLFDKDKYYDAIVRGNTSMANTIKADLIDTAVKNGKTRDEAEESLSSSVRSEVRELYLDGKISDSKTYDALITYGDRDAEDAESLIDSWSFEKRYGFSYSDRAEAYKKGEVSEYEMYNILTGYGEMTEQEAENTIKAYNWMKRNPSYDLTVSQALSYTKAVENVGESPEDSGISPDVFVEYLNLQSKCKGFDNDSDGKADRNSKKNQILEVIDNLPITSYQKDVLYFMNGWARSNLRKAPWH